MTSLKIALIGTGGMGTVHLSNYAHIEHCNVVALCDTTPAAQDVATRLNIPLYQSIDELLANEDVDVVDICTPTFLHKTHAMTALTAGKHVICEKPIALHHADAVELLDMAEEKGVGLFVGQVLQYSMEVCVLRDLVQSNVYGKMLDASFLRLSACPRWVKNGWLFDKERSGLLPFDLHIHDLDLIVSLFGKPDSASHTSVGREGLSYTEHHRFQYRFGTSTVSAEAAWFNAEIPFTATWRVYFEQAVVEYDGTRIVAYQFDVEPREFDIAETLKIPTGINLAPTGMFHRELSDFLSQIRTGCVGSPRREELLTVISLLEGVTYTA